ncbi:retrovirus-related pol polyprotein from transposon TNT 1-94 [Tanacetum coccineum]|uniref:Retrovirus-related pol polyprotein from transposon TNT 1-94 n=1 Tax=Tanacetum coccineum TaxID=301880 RepID=A0ABQ5F0P4_9ASTR
MVDDKVEKVPSTSTLVDPTSSNWARPVLTNARLAVEVFDGTCHFGMWQSEVLDALFQQGLDIAIEESKPEDVEERNWLTINQLACGTIMNDHITSFNQLVFDLMNIDEVFKDQDLALILLGSLPEEYELLETTLLNGKDDVSLSEVCASLYSKELKRKDKHISSSGDAEVLLVRGRSQKKGTDKRWRSKSRQRLSKDECAFCHEKAEANVTKCDDEELYLSLATSSSRNAYEIWLLDSACSHHITPHREWFSNFEEHEEVVYIADETPLTTHGIGSVRLQNKDGTIVTLKGVHYSPKLKKNLIFVGTLESKGFEVRAKDGVMKIISGVLVVIKGIHKINNTYHYKGRTVVRTVADVTDGDRNLKDIKLWHMCLGHAGEKSLNFLIKQGLLKGLSSCKLDLCEHCINGKTTRVKFGTAIHKTQGILDNVHSDVWGPSKTRSLGGRHYYVTFVDDFSQRVWVYTLKRQRMKHFTVIHNTTTEWGGCMQEPNLAGERLECRFIRQMLDYDSLHVFGFAAYYHVKESKLDPRAKKALFMRITSGIKGYRLWCPEIKKTIFSRDVTFNESTMLKKVNVEKLDGTPKKVEFERLIVPADREIDDNSLIIEGDFEEEEVQTKEPRQQQHESIATSKPKRNTKRPARLNDTVACTSPIAVDDVPTTYSKALTNLPEGKKAIRCKWVYAKKEGFPGQDDVRYKARLVAKGYAQKEGIDYNDVFSPVVKHSSIRILLALVAQLDLELVQMDMKTTFLHGDLEEEIYMVQPEGFKVAGKEHEVYDMLISLDEIETLKTQLKSEFEMKDLGEAKMILGMEIVRDRKLRKLCLTQKQYLRKVLKHFRFDKQTKRVSTPLASQFKISAAMSPKDDAERAYMEKVPYANAVGSLMYAMICTRPDISHAVEMVSRYMHNPGKGHWQAVKWILRYIHNTVDVGLVFEHGSSQWVAGYCDSDYAGDLDKRRSNRLWLLGELGIKQKFVTMHSDSQSAIHLAKNQVYHARTKHIDVRYHFIREILEEGGVRIQKIHTSKNPADMLTKVVAEIKINEVVFRQGGELLVKWLNWEDMQICKLKEYATYAS